MFVQSICQVCKEINMNTLLNPTRYVINQFEIDTQDGEPCFLICGRLKGIYLTKDHAEKVCEIKQKGTELFLEVCPYFGD